MRMFLLKNRWLILVGILLLVAGGCQQPSSTDYSDKFWAHQANDTLTAQQKQQKFAGLEVDLVYSSYQNELFVGHELYDTARQLTFKQWVNALDEPATSRFWLDVKNLDTANAEQISNLILRVTEPHKITRRVLVENPSHKALQIVKAKGLPVLLWVDNLYWIEPKDTLAWLKTTKKHLKKLQPDGLSCEYRLYPLLNNSFPKESIYYWHTPCEKTPENVAFDKQLANEKNIKVILVDYDEPVTF